MKITVLTTSFPRFKDDYAGIFVYDLTESIKASGDEITVVAPKSDNCNNYDMWDGIAIRRFTYFFPKKYQKVAYGTGIPANLRNSLLAKLQVPFFMMAFLLKAMSVCRKSDIIHAHWVPAGLVAVILSKIFKIRTVLTIQKLISSPDWKKQSSVINLLNKYVLKNTDIIITVSEAIKEKMKALGIKEDKIKVIRNGVRIHEFPYVEKKSNEKRILWIGRMYAEKGLDYLIEAMNIITKKDPEIKLTLIGEGIEKKYIESKIAHFGLGNNISLKGIQPRDKLYHFMKNSDIFVLPSLLEGYPLVLLEAMSSGVPCISTNIDGVNELIKNGINGYIVEPENTDELADRIYQLINDKNLQLSIGRKAREIIEKELTWEIIGQKTRNIYNGLKEQK